MSQRARDVGKVQDVPLIEVDHKVPPPIHVPNWIGWIFAVGFLPLQEDLWTGQLPLFLGLLRMLTSGK